MERLEVSTSHRLPQHLGLEIRWRIQKDAVQSRFYAEVARRCGVEWRGAALQLGDDLLQPRSEDPGRASGQLRLPDRGTALRTSPVRT